MSVVVSLVSTSVEQSIKCRKIFGENSAKYIWDDFLPFVTNTSGLSLTPDGVKNVKKLFSDDDHDLKQSVEQMKIWTDA